MIGLGSDTNRRQTSTAKTEIIMFGLMIEVQR